MFRRIKGQNQVVDLLQRAIEQQRIAQAYLFHGSDGVGKFMTALYFGMALPLAISFFSLSIQILSTSFPQ